MAIIDITAALEADSSASGNTMGLDAFLSATASIEPNFVRLPDVDFSATSSLSAALSSTRFLTSSLSGSATVEVQAHVVHAGPPPPPPPPPIADVHLLPVGHYVMENGGYVHVTDRTPFDLKMGTLLRDVLDHRWRVEWVEVTGGTQRTTLSPVPPTPYSVRPRGNLRLDPSP